MFGDFHQLGRFVRSLNVTFITMVPQKGGVEDFKDYRPICLIGSLYKLLAKVLENRLKKFFPELVNKGQYTFVSESQILDAMLIANEIVDSMLKRNVN